MHTAAQFENGCWLADELQDRIGGRLQVFVDEDGACVERGHRSLIIEGRTGNHPGWYISRAHASYGVGPKPGGLLQTAT
jgi:hypothetical protein